MNHETNRFLQAAFIVLFHFGGAFFALSVFFRLDQAVFIALMVTGVAVLIYIWLIFTDNADQGLPLGLLLLSPIIYITIGLIWWSIRLVLSYLGNWPPRF